MDVKTNQFHKIFIFIILFLVSYYGLKTFAHDDLEDYWVDCKECVEAQESLTEAISKYKSENKSNNIKDILDRNYQPLIRELYESGYLKKLVVGAKGKCSFRYDTETSELYCIKHGALEYVNGYKYYHERLDSKKRWNLIIAMCGIGLLIFCIIWG